jgi:hypothetical protein
MTEIFGCGQGGWTLVMKVDGGKVNHAVQTAYLLHIKYILNNRELISRLLNLQRNSKFRKTILFDHYKNRMIEERFIATTYPRIFINNILKSHYHLTLLKEIRCWQGFSQQWARRI